MPFILLTPLTPLVFIFALLWYKHNLTRKRASSSNPHGLPFPPGPAPRLLVGNLFDLARENEVEAYHALAREYGDLVFLNVLGKKVLFVNSFSAANDLFEKRSANYSDRGHSVMLNELMGWDWAFGHMPYGEKWRTHRRMFHRQFAQSVATVHWPAQRREAHRLLRRLMDADLGVEGVMEGKGEGVQGILRHNAASVIMNITYGISVEPKNDRYVAIAECALEGMAEAASPGRFWVDLVPMLKYVPEWMPGAGFKRKAREWREAACEMRDRPFEAVVHAMRVGTARPCFVTNLLGGRGVGMEGEGEVEVVKACAGMSYVAGTESILSALSSFVLAVTRHPEVQVRAQEELDRVVGSGRLPDWEDRAALVFVGAVVKEVLRWSPVAPLGLPHVATRDDEYAGYFIPKGTMVVGNSWAILHDPVTFPDPSRFDPTRFLSPRQLEEGDDDDEGTGPDSFSPLSVAFGYGRRMCPGRYMAEAQLWISIACMLAVFDVRGGEREREQVGERERVPEFTSGLIRHPMPFGCEMRLRGEWARVLVEQTESLDGVL